MLDYKEKYNKLVEAVKALQEANPSDEEIRNWVNNNVPELKEHEDKRIKTFIKGLLLPHIYDIDVVGDEIKPNKDIDIYRKALTWLEKQGEQKPVDKEYTFKSIPRLLDMIEPSEKAKFYCQKLIDTLTKEGYNTDVKIVGECLKRMNGEKVGMATMDEKGIKDGNSIDPHFGKPITTTETKTKKFKVKYAGKEYNVLEIRNIDGVTFYGIEDEPNHIDYVKAGSCKIISGYAIKENGSPYPTKPAVFSKQNPADKVEPKFQNGQWIVWQDKCYKVNYNGCGYELIDQNGLKTSLEYGTVDKSAHLWTIKDAKDGDVLCVYNNIFIFKEHINWEYRVYSYCELHNGEKLASIHPAYICSGEEETLKPATKEQCELLFRKMKEEGFEWDATTKELSKKIATGESDKVVWSEEDEIILNGIIDDFGDGKTSNMLQESWLKSIKERIQPQPKQDGKWKWEEDDEKFFKENILIELGNIDGVSPELYSKIIDWLDLIKKRLS